MQEIEETKGRGLIAGYKPNRISFYITLLSAGRIEMLEEVLWKDMEKYKEGDEDE
jgi:hypothetical protein